MSQADDLWSALFLRTADRPLCINSASEVPVRTGRDYLYSCAVAGNDHACVSDSARGRQCGMSRLTRILHEHRREAFETEARRGFSP